MNESMNRNEKMADVLVLAKDNNDVLEHLTCAENEAQGIFLETCKKYIVPYRTPNKDIVYKNGLRWVFFADPAFMIVLISADLTSVSEELGSHLNRIYTKRCLDCGKEVERSREWLSSHRNLICHFCRVRYN
jgi:hypothetical protein